MSHTADAYLATTDQNWFTFLCGAGSSWATLLSDTVDGYLATTDQDWFTFLRAKAPAPDEVNFWQPSAHGFNRPPGTPVLFKLKAPHNAIGGFGVFARYEPATPRLA